MDKKRIFIIAPKAYGIEESISQAFRDLGFEVILKNSRGKLNLIEKISMKIAKEIPFTKTILNQNIKFFLDKENKNFLVHINKIKPDILFIIKGETIFPEALKFIKDKLKIPCVAYIWDCPFYSYAGQNADVYRRSNFANGMGYYDHIFVYDPYYVEEIKKHGITNITYLPLATDLRQYRTIETTQNELKNFSFDITFVGSPFPNRIEILDKLTEFNLGVFGDGWDKSYKAKLLPSYYKGTATGEKVLKIYASSKIVLNIHDPETRYGLNTRTFDILASGAFELVDYRRELESLFNIGEEIVCYKDIDDLKRLIRFYLDNPEERLRIVKNGKTKVENMHTWHHRLERVVNVLNTKGLL